MGGHEGWVQPNGFFPNGLLPNEEASVTRVLDPERWSLAEERTADLISHIQPNQPSEERREAVACYVQRLIAKCFSCRVVTFGSVPLKTYLPDGDIDLTTFSDTQNLKDSWANEVRDVLESEEKSEDAEFCVKEVQYIQAEVKIIKCLVENIVVDISFNQLGGLCTLCFLEEVDQLINQNHLFKRSIILIKAWCYYESRILGAHHGLISTYALETMVLYIFHVFNNSCAGPLEVLYRFLEFFSKFDWDNFCVSLWGPVAINSLPDMRADPPRKDSGELLLSKLFLNACSSVYAVFPVGQENQEQPFISKHFNVIDPLRTNNNLGRSVSKGNFFRIRSAFAFGAQRLARLLECPKGNIIAEVNQFFMNTWDRHGKGHRADAPSPALHGLQQVNFNQIDGSDSVKNHSGRKKVKEDGVSSQHGTYSLKRVSRSGNVSVVSRGQSQETYANLTSSMPSDQNHQIPQCISSNGNTVADKGKNSRPDYFQSEVHGRYQVVRTHSSPELTETSSEIPSQGRHNRASETGKGQTTAKLENNRRRNLGSEVAEKQSGRFSFEDSPSSRQNSSQRSIDAAFDLNNTSNSYVEFGSGGMGEDHRFVVETMQVRQEEQDLVNMMASSRFRSFNGHVQMRVNLSSAHSPLPIPPSILGSLGYAHRNSACLVPTSIPSFDSPWSSNIHHSQGLISLPVSQCFPSIGMASNREEMAEPVDDNLVSAELNQDNGKHGLWCDRNAHSVRGYDRHNQSYEGQLEERQQFAAASNFGHLSRGSSSDSYSPKDNGLNKENRRCIKENYGDNPQYQTIKESDTYSTASSRLIPSSQATSGITPSTEKVWDSKLARDKRGRKAAPSTDSSDVYVLGKNRWQYDSESVDHAFSQADDDDTEWIPLSTATTDPTECIGSGAAASSLVRTHHPHGYEHSEVSGSNSMLPVAPVLVGSGSRQRAIDNNGVLPFAFYPTGPPVPFLTMLPVYNFPNEMETSSASTNHFEGDEELNNFCVSHSDLSLDSTKNLDQSEIFDNSNIMKAAAAVESSEEHKPDILNSDFMSHWHNLQYGRFCQNARHNDPLLNRSSAVAVPPMYLHGNFPLDVPGRPPANMNLFTQLMSYSPRLIPVMPLQPGSNRAAGVYQHHADEIPTYRGGTGTYLPNPKISFRDRHSSNTRNHRGNYSYDRKDRHGDREGTWHINSKSQYTGRGQGRNQVEKSSLRLDRTTANNSQADKSWDSLKDDSLPSYGSFSSSNALTHGSAKAAYGMYPLPVMNPSGVKSSGAFLPSVVMLYPYDQNMDYGSPAEHLEFGSLGPVHYPSINEVSHLGGGSSRSVKEQRNYLGDSIHSSTDQPSLPNLQR